jgi:hypothetical protein
MRPPVYVRRHVPASTGKRLGRGIWIPCDFFIGLALRHDRMLHVPSLLLEKYPAHRGNRGYVRLEASLLLTCCIIIDLRRL